MKQFTFRLSKAKPDEFWQSIKTAKVKERNHSERNGDYVVEFYKTYNQNENKDQYIVGVSHLSLLPRRQRLDVVTFDLTTLGDGLRVDVEYSDFPTYNGYVMGLLQEIAKDWREAQEAVNQHVSPDRTQVGARENEEHGTAKVSQRTEALNKLAVLWVTYNQTQRISKNDDMEWFIGENVAEVGLDYLSVNEFKRHLPKAYKAQIIDKDAKTGRFIPKLRT